jgi:CheY-like chemotaxis protein
MTPQQLRHLFEPFNRLGNEGHGIEGSGIGLTLTRQLTKLMNGRLDIESAADCGTRARLVLPACAIPLKVASEPQVSRPAPGAAERAVVLNIEDDPVNQILVEQMLLQCPGVRLVQAANGEDGIVLARTRRPDLVLLDMQLPDMSGLEVLAALHNDPRTRSMRVAAVSANAITDDIARTLATGALAYWTKPLQLESFRAGISSLLSVPVSLDAAALATSTQSSNDIWCGARCSNRAVRWRNE